MPAGGAMHTASGQLGHHNLPALRLAREMHHCNWDRPRPRPRKLGPMLSLGDRYIPLARAAAERRKVSASRKTRAATTVAAVEDLRLSAFRFPYCCWAKEAKRPPFDCSKGGVRE